jgi:hypothetical protein
MIVSESPKKGILSRPFTKEFANFNPRKRKINSMPSAYINK